MIRYHLDDLGWLQFEQLVQSLLKADLGIGVESWGERHDYGRDAYCKRALHFPSKHLLSEGPFVFQVKFAENANAAGASTDAIILQAARSEIVQIKRRHDESEWGPPRHYVLITNASISGPIRLQLTSIFQAAFPEISFHSLGGKDICDLLDNNPNIRRSFPQLLSLRDLDELLHDVVRGEVLERSNRAKEIARDFVPTFVPTGAYDRTWSVLRKHHFAVLEGPPEMGKTAIAWMIALVQHSQGWEALVCDEPKDIYECPSSTNPQIFIADDAFGRTEYDPARLKKWETQLDRVFRRLDGKHWLIWTSRKHILERARRLMDLQGKASGFPNPGAVLVNASSLSLKEKSLILYRHARAAGLEENAKHLVRKHARQIIGDHSFTPERIRRFVKERLPQLVTELDKGLLTPQKVSSEVQEAIRNPTDRMRKAFRALSSPHKWILISLLEAGYLPTLDKLKQLYESHCPVDDHRPFEEAFEELTESFVKSQTFEA